MRHCRSATEPFSLRRKVTLPALLEVSPLFVRT
jgi:hypothetical protein